MKFRGTLIDDLMATVERVEQRAKSEGPLFAEHIVERWGRLRTRNYRLPYQIPGSGIVPSAVGNANRSGFMGGGNPPLPCINPKVDKMRRPSC